MDGEFLAKASPLDGLCDLVGFDPAELEDGRNIIVGLVFGQVLVDPQCRGRVAGGTEGSHVNKAIVIQLMGGRVERVVVRKEKAEEERTAMKRM